jgi:hypothetical protein
VKEQYRIYSRNFEGFKAQIAKLNVRCAKLGVPAIVINELSVEEQEVKNELGVVVRVERWNIVELEGAQPKFQGWTLAAVVEHAEEGNILRKAPGCSVDLVNFRQGAPRCDHCKAIRNRKDTFIVLHEDGAQKQIGSNCIKDFLGHQDPHMLAKWAEICFSAGELASEAGDEGCEGWGRRGVEFVSCKAIVSLANAAIRNKGFVSGSAAKKAYEERGQHLTTTADFVRTALHPNFSGPSPDKEGVDFFTPIDQDREVTEKAIAYVLDTIGAQDPEKLSDFEHNLLMVCKCTSVEPRNIGLLAYVPEHYARSLERAAEKANAAPEAYFGEVGKRFRDIELTYVKSTGWDSQYGYTYLHMFRGPAQERMNWKTGTDLGLEPGAVVKATFTVKAHEVYKETLQTKITRAKI